MQALAPSALFFGYGALLLLLGGYTLYRRGQQAPVPVEEQEHVVVAVPESQVASEFDPRTEDIDDVPLEELIRDPEQPVEMDSDDVEKP
jgi:hypothetical protein